MANRTDIVFEARKWVGVPYRHQGRSRTGVDCIGLAVVVVRELGLMDYDIDGYSRVPSGRMMTRLMAERLQTIDLADAQPGDLLHMAFTGQPQHVAIVSSDNPARIIHADAVAGRVVEHALDANWRGLVRGAYRIPL